MDSHNGSESLCRCFYRGLYGQERKEMKQAQTDFRYVKTMLVERRRTNKSEIICPNDLSDLYVLLFNYWSVYWQWNEERETILLHLIAEIEYLYNAQYPYQPDIELNWISRNAGLLKKHEV